MYVIYVLSPPGRGRLPLDGDVTGSRKAPPRLLKIPPSRTKKTSAVGIRPMAAVFISYIEYERIGRYTHHV